MTSKSDKPDDLIELKPKYGFWLRPIARLNISVQLPQLIQGKAISTSSVMEKINKRAKTQFKSLKITKTTIDFLRLEGELESLKQLEIVEQRLNRVKIKLDGFEDQLKLKANKIKFSPLKHEWESFFRDNPQMDELKPGYRPDTIVIQNLPLKWFGNHNLKTNWLINVFSVFGDIRRFHVPLIDEMEKEKAAQKKSSSEISTSFKKFNFNSEHLTFDAYLMYKDYVGFVNAMDNLRGMKLVKCEKNNDNKPEYLEHEIKIDFDKTKHLSDKAIRRRQIAKKYGIETLDDLNEYKKKAKERKTLYEERTKQLKKQRKSAKNVLNFLARLVEIDEKKREEEELKKLNERLLKERLLEEEKKLRNKLIERKRNQVMEQLKEQQNKSDTEHEPDRYDESYKNDNRNNNNYSHNRNANNYNYNRDDNNCNQNYQSEPLDYAFRNPNYLPHHRNNEFNHSNYHPNHNSNPNLNSNFNKNFTQHSGSYHQPHNNFRQRPISRFQFNPYQTVNNAPFNRNPNYQNRPNYYANSSNYNNERMPTYNRYNHKSYNQNSYQNEDHHQNRYNNQNSYQNEDHQNRYNNFRPEDDDLDKELNKNRPKSLIVCPKP